MKQKEISSDKFDNSRTSIKNSVISTSPDNNKRLDNFKPSNNNHKMFRQGSNRFQGKRELFKFKTEKSFKTEPKLSENSNFHLSQILTL